MATESTFEGGCHCKAVRFKVQADPNFTVVQCNCSICTMKGYLHLIVPSSKFQLVSGEELITTYTFGSHTAKHTFCSRCGISPFYIPRSNPDGYDVNTRCLDNWVDGEANHKVEPFDGQNWEDNAASLKHLSEEK